MNYQPTYGKHTIQITENDSTYSVNLSLVLYDEITVVAKRSYLPEQFPTSDIDKVNNY